LLIELDDLDQVLAMYTALSEERPAGVIDIVPAARTVLLIIDPEATDLGEVGRAVLQLRPRLETRAAGQLLEVPVTYDGEDLDEVGSLLGCDADEVIRRHAGETWTVAFCGFAPGFGYLSAASGGWDVPRQSSPRTTVPPGSVALAGEFSGIYQTLTRWLAAHRAHRVGHIRPATGSAGIVSAGHARPLC
jgi:allophanate hydrolase subunit 1